MHFANERELQDFLIEFLKSKNHTCQKEALLPNGDKIDILTQMYIIECKYKLNVPALDKAIGQLVRYQLYCSDRTPVVAGMADDAGRRVAASYRQQGYRVWFIDEIPEIVDFWEENYGEQEEEEAYEPAYTYPSSHAYSSPSYRSSYDYEGVFGISAGAVVVVLLFIGGIILLGNVNYSLSVTKLHEAAKAWDMQLAQQSIADLAASKDQCDRLLAQGMRTAIAQEGTYALNRINQVQKVVENVDKKCRFPTLHHSNQLK